MKLQIGDTAPDFDFIDKDGNTHSFHSVNRTKIVFFFPKAFTPGCTKESCSIRDNYEELKNKGYSEIFGVSTDSHEKQMKFAKEYDLNFILVDDKSKKISKEYGVLMNAVVINVSKRCTFIVDEENKMKEATYIVLCGSHT